MVQLSGFAYRDIVRRLKFFGFAFLRQAAGSHEIWYSKSTGRYTTIPNHTGDMPQGTLRAILKQAGISVEDFINKKSNQ
jgi:predicted RNA binding protein YcfA (HicA-like mRNA interferase family)